MHDAERGHCGNWVWQSWWVAIPGVAPATCVDLPSLANRLVGVEIRLVATAHADREPWALRVSSRLLVERAYTRLHP
jgi:hypothetical protein